MILHKTTWVLPLVMGRWRFKAIIAFLYFYFLQITLGCCHAMLCISAAYAIVRCLSVCPSRSVFSRNFSPLGSHTILVFQHQTLWQYSDGDPSSNSVEGKNQDFRPVSCFTVCCQHSAHQMLSIRCDARMLQVVQVDDSHRWYSS